MKSTEAQEASRNTPSPVGAQEDVQSPPVIEGGVGEGGASEGSGRDIQWGIEVGGGIPVRTAPGVFYVCTIDFEFKAIQHK